MKYNGIECEVIEVIGNVSLIKIDGVVYAVTTTDLTDDEPKKKSKK